MGRGDTVLFRVNLRHSNPDLGIIPKGQMATVKDYMGEAVMVTPWNTGHETLVNMKDLIIKE